MHENEPVWVCVFHIARVTEPLYFLNRITEDIEIARIAPIVIIPFNANTELKYPPARSSAS